MEKKIRVLIVDDSAVVRQTLAEVLASDPEIEIMGTAADPLIAAERMKEEIPDVITLDVEMPRMDGLTFMQKIMTQHPIPVVMCSSLTGRGSENFAQDEASCIVFGMPKEAIRLGGVTQVLPLEEIAPAVVRACREQEKGR